MSWIDNPPYPWQNPLARDLKKQLLNTFFNPPEILQLVKSADAPDWTNVNFANPPNLIWNDVLAQAAAQGSLRTLLEYVAGENRTPKALTNFVKNLLDDKSQPADPTPGGQAGPDFASEVTQEEALLFGEDLSESVGVIPDLIAGIQKVMRWSSAVCRLRVTAPGGVWGGTGTLLTGNRVLTNHHVLFPEKQKAGAVSVEFNYETGPTDNMLPSIVTPGDVATIKASEADDWAVITVAPPPGAAPLDLAANVAPARVAQRALILQHPVGRPKRLAFIRNRISSLADRRVYYLTDTESGSSGSPVFNMTGQIVALHRAGGTPQKLIGVDPVKKNEGVRMDFIAPDIMRV